MALCEISAPQKSTKKVILNSCKVQLSSTANRFRKGVQFVCFPVYYYTIYLSGNGMWKTIQIQCYKVCFLKLRQMRSGFDQIIFYSFLTGVTCTKREVHQHGNRKPNSSSFHDSTTFYIIDSKFYPCTMLSKFFMKTFRPIQHIQRMNFSSATVVLWRD